MADRLSTYRAKRDFSKTPEPQSGRSAGSFLRYAMQKHDARRVHYDLRLEHDGVLLSWAVTKGPSLSPVERRLAVRTEDHPLDYASFEGVIPEGYGAGAVMLWDEGAWEPLDEVETALSKGRLRIRLDGRRLKGEWTLARMGREGSRENWLFIKRRDEAADRGEPTEAWTTSVKTGRDLDEITAGAPAPERTEPAFAQPMLATLVEHPPSGSDWLHEIKHDGYRVIVVIRDGRAKLHTRSGLDWTDRFGSLPTQFEALGLDDAVIDGEVVAQGKAGESDFSVLQKVLSDGGALVCYVFDLLHLEGEDLSGQTLAERRRRLREILGEGTGSIRFSDDVVGDGDAVLEVACRLGGEGIVSKRADSRYRSERSKAWLKTKCVNRAEFVVGGYRKSKANRPFASLLVGTFEDGRFVYRGGIGSGFDGDALETLSERLKPLERKEPPFDALPRDARRQAVWVEPKLVVEARYAEITADGAVRHATYVGLREDKPAEAVAVDRPREAAVKITNAEKVLYPDAGVTKGELADYIETVADRMLPYVAGRPLTLVRCPNGRDKCFFQKHLGKGTPDSVKPWLREGDPEPFMVVEDVEGLVACAQLGALEFHIGGARVIDPTRPERLVFDLDPDPSVDFETVKEAAWEVRGVLAAAGLESFPLITGGKGVHVVVPLEPEAEWDLAKGFARSLAYALAKARPDRYVAKMSKAKRKGLIFLDWLRNGDGASAIAPYSPRARPGAPAATPLDWATLAKTKRGDACDLKSLRARLVRLRKDPWGGYQVARRSLTPQMAEAVKRLL